MSVTSRQKQPQSSSSYQFWMEGPETSLTNENGLDPSSSSRPSLLSDDLSAPQRMRTTSRQRRAASDDTIAFVPRVSFLSEGRRRERLTWSMRALTIVLSFRAWMPIVVSWDLADRKRRLVTWLTLGSLSSMVIPLVIYAKNLKHLLSTAIKIGFGVCCLIVDMYLHTIAAASCVHILNSWVDYISSICLIVVCLSDFVDYWKIWDDALPRLLDLEEAIFLQ